MIWESHYWKEDLVRSAKRLRKRIKQRRWSETSFAKLEKEVFIGFYGVRKLLEAKKLSERLIKKRIPVQAFKFTGARPITYFNWNSKCGDAYDFEKPAKLSMSLMFLCNQVVHSYVFKEVFDEDGALSGIFINSDREKNRMLYYVPLAEIVKLFTRVGNDYPSRHQATFDPTRGDFIVKNW